MTNATRIAALGALALAAAPAALRAQSESDKLAIHGYITQGYAGASGSSFQGIPTDATGDYRSAALQFRYGITDKDNVVVQIRHRSLGTGILAAAEPNVELNWAYYQRKIGSASVKAGKLPIARGIYNEVRSVGTVLPFYRAPLGFYMEGFETLDGAAVANTFDLGKLGSLDATAFGGGFAVRGASTDPQTGRTSVYNSRMEAVHGAQLWMSTPIQGLRLGLGGLRYRSQKQTDTSTAPMGSAWHTGVDANFGRASIRGEYFNTAYGQGMGQGYYVQGGVQVTSRLALNVQNDFSDQRVTVPGIDRKWRAHRDFAVGANYLVSPNLALKLEHHDAKYQDGVVPVLMGRAPSDTRYFIASVSTSF